MKKVLLVMVLLFVNGCGMPTQQDYQNWTATLDAVIPAVKEVAGDNPKLDKIIGDVELVRASVADAKTLPEAVSKGLEASKPFNPYADEMNAILGLAVVLGGLFAKSKIKAKEDEKELVEEEKRVVTNKYSAAKKGVNEFLAGKNTDLYKSIGDARKAKGIA